MERGSISSITIYNKVVAKIERFSKLTRNILMKVSPVAIMVPAIVATYFKYYVLGLGDASFPYLPFTYGISGFFPSLFQVQL